MESFWSSGPFPYREAKFRKNQFVCKETEFLVTQTFFQAIFFSFKLRPFPSPLPQHSLISGLGGQSRSLICGTTRLKIRARHWMKREDLGSRSWKHKKLATETRLATLFANIWPPKHGMAAVPNAHNRKSTQRFLNVLCVDTLKTLFWINIL